MMKKLLKSAAAVLAASLLLFVGCSSDSGSGDENLSGGGGNPGNTPSEPVITGPVSGGVTELHASNEELETAYITWKAAGNAKWYNIYVKAHDDDDTAYTKLDAPLVRQYADYFRADALGLKAGQYDMKVVPVAGDDTEAADLVSTATNITVKAHDRSGYAFTGGNVPGAYNMDGTLKVGAQVIYVTAANAKTVKAVVNGSEVTGFQSILDARNKGATDPICFRIVGIVTKSDLDHISSSSEGLQIKGKGANAPTENITIEGVGNDGTINGFGMLIRYCKNVEIKNLGLVNFMDDGVSIDTGNSHLWVHNLDIFYGSAGGDSDQAKGDGSLDSKGSDYCTYSYNHFWDSGKCNLLGNGDSESSGEGGTTHLTYHHNWYDHSDSRHPRIRIATVHVYNNYFDGNSKYGVGVTMGASAFVENNYFRSTAKMKPMLSSLQGTDIAHGKDGQTFSGEAGGMIKAYGNKIDGTAELLTQNDTEANNIDCYLASSRDEKVPETYKTKQGGTVYNNFDTDADFYEYTPDSAEYAKKNVEKYAGRIDGGDLQYDFDDATQDANYAVITELKTKIMKYKSSVIKIGKIAGSDNGSTGGNTDTGGGTEGGSGSGSDNAPVDTSKSVVVTFDSFTSGSSINGVTVTGNLKSGIDSKTYGGTTYTTALKMESSTSISFTLDNPASLTLVTDAASRGIKIDGTKKTTDADGVVSDEVLEAGSHTVTKSDSVNLYAIIITPAE